MEDFEKCTKEELIQKLKTLTAHNTQLKNIIAKANQTPKSQEKSKKPFNFQKCNFRHVLLKFFYLGWDYQGYVVQEDTTNTVEHHIFEALLKTCLIENRTTSNYHRCGRTDKGVSSFSQVISLNLRSINSDPDKELNYCKILNKVLPDNIQFIAWSPVDQQFSARFNCRSRTYKYFFPKGKLDIEKMRVAASYLVGTHDFRNFCKMDVNNGVVEFIRNITSVDIADFHGESYGKKLDFSMCVLSIKGNAFLWHQIRYIVAILVLIGQNKEKPDLVLELLDIASNPRKPDYHMASEIPLNLYDCEYDDVKWIYEKESLNMAIKKLYNFWTFTTIRSSMMKNMLKDLEKEIQEYNDCPSNYLLQGIKTKTYVPVMKRQLCESLEDRIEHCVKKKRKNAV